MTTEIKCSLCAKHIGFADDGEVISLVVCGACRRSSHAVLVESQRCYEVDNLDAADLDKGELAAASATYALYNAETKPFRPFWSMFWPFDADLFLPSKSRSRNLVQALAYLVAELNRLELTGQATPCVCTPEMVCPHCKQATQEAEVKSTAA